MLPLHGRSKEDKMNFNIHEKLVKKEKALAVIGLGYVGLPLALIFARKYRVIGFDINEERVKMMKENEDPSKELPKEAFQGCDITFSSDPEVLKDAQFYIIGVPTPVDKHRVPDLKAVLSASDTVGKYLKRGDYVVYESTVYPGCTEEDCLPILEKNSGLKMGTDFKLGYSPERINPGDKEHTVEKILKVVSGNDEEALTEISKVYGDVITAGVYKASSIKVAEAAKVIENTQRDINISFMNELAMIFDLMDIDTSEVLDAAGTKWNFLKFAPGLVGGHCIGVDPYYLAYKSQQLGYNPQVILSGRRINDSVPDFIAKRLTQLLIKKGKNPNASKVLVMGITFKENVSDIRNSKVADLIKELQDFSMTVDVVDPQADPAEVYDEYGIYLKESPQNNYDAVIAAVSHDEYKELSSHYFKSITLDEPIIMDLKGIYTGKFGDDITYWRL